MKLRYIHKKELTEILVSNIFRYFILLILLNNCSLDTKSGIWSDKKDTILEKSKEKITCECGKIFTICNKTRHAQSNKHQNYLKSIQLVKLLQ